MTILPPPRRRPHQPVTRRYCSRRGIIHHCLMQEMLGMTGHHARLRMREMFGSHQRQAIQPHVVHRPRRGTNVARTLWTHQDDGNLSCVWLWTHGLYSLSGIMTSLGSHCNMDISHPHKTSMPLQRIVITLTSRRSFITISRSEERRVGKE